MLADKTYAVGSDFKFWFVNTVAAQMTDAERLNLIKLFYDRHVIDANELGFLASTLDNPNLLQAILSSLAPPNEREFVQTDFYIKHGNLHFGIIRYRKDVSNTVIDPADEYRLWDISWAEPFGIIPLTEQLFIARSIQPAMRRTSEGVTPPFCLIIPEALVWDIPHKIKCDPILFGGWRINGKAKQLKAPEEVTELLPEVTTAFQIVSFDEKS